MAVVISAAVYRVDSAEGADSVAASRVEDSVAASAVDLAADSTDSAGGSAVLTGSGDLGEDSDASGSDSTGIFPLASDLILFYTATGILTTDPVTPAITARALTVGMRIRT